MSKIQWTDETWNPTVGCTRVSPGCEHCYAERVAHRGMQEAHRGLTTERGRWNGSVKLLPDRLEQPLHWRKPRRVFVDSMSDLFHEDVQDSFIDRVFAVMAMTPLHAYQILTKRPERMREYLIGCSADRIINAAVRQHDASLPRSSRVSEAVWELGEEWPLSNVQLGVSAEDQARLDERVPHLLATPAAVRFLSLEPLLGPVDPTRVDAAAFDAESSGIALDALRGGRLSATPWHINWVIVGGESGPGARPCDVDWIRSIVRQCRAAGVPCFVKQLGSYAILDPRYDRRLPGWTRKLRDPKGGDWNEWPEDLRVREFPGEREG